MTRPKSAVADIAVIAIRDDGRCVIFSRFDTEAAARSTIAALRRLGLRAEIGCALPTGPCSGYRVTR